MVSIPSASELNSINWDKAHTSGSFDGEVTEFGGSVWVKVDLKTGSTYSMFANGFGDSLNDATFTVYNSSGQDVLDATFGAIYTATLSPTSDGPVYIQLKMASAFPGQLDFGITTQAATNKMFFSTNDDTYTGAYGERIFGFNGNDNLTLGSAFSASGGLGDDVIQGNSGSNQIWGDQGDDFITSGGGDDVIWGGDGRDNIQANAAGNVQLFGGAGADKVYAFEATTAYIDGGSGGDFIYGSSGIDTIHGGADGDRINGNGGADFLYGDGGNDQIFGTAGSQTIDGGDGDDILSGNAGGDKLSGGSGSDTASYDTATAGVSVYMTKMQNNTGDAAGDTFKSIENLTGSDYADNLYADGSASTLKGGAGADVLYGNNGVDKLTGGTGADTFLYREVSDSRTTSYDIVYDFSESDGDKFDLSGLDASTKVSGNNAFVFIGNDAFSGSAGQLRYQTSGNNTDIFADTNGDKKADFQIHLSAAQTLHAGDFIV